MTLKDEILELLQRRPGLTDRELTDLLRGRSAPQQPVNIACRGLEQSGQIARRRARPTDGFIGNFPTGVDAAAKTIRRERAPVAEDLEHLSEDDIKSVLERWLDASGWDTKIAWGKTQGIDIDASRGAERWIIEVKGPGSRQAMRVNYFLAILGETLQRMSEEQAGYSIALPDMPQYRRLWDRLPELAKNRTKITLLLVTKDGQVEHLGL